MDGEIHREIRRERYALLARLRRVERRFEVVERRWTEFRDGPSPPRLAVLRRSVAAAERELSLLAGALHGGPGIFVDDRHRIPGCHKWLPDPGNSGHIGIIDKKGRPVGLDNNPDRGITLPDLPGGSGDEQSISQGLR